MKREDWIYYRYFLPLPPLCLRLCLVMTLSNWRNGGASQLPHSAQRSAGRADAKRNRKKKSEVSQTNPYW
ncbi:hypothetical protein IF1G_06134 [Cordyceps javanica]|uniref:Uncharacterized protein n=1 Tax=Cordyceps javanica TaxID=43265 RepID=A0A545V0C5_9HYPO|nr:hypothetical protein IF1G_06134 [Cordyceps javanica]